MRLLLFALLACSTLSACVLTPPPSPVKTTAAVPASVQTGLTADDALDAFARIYAFSPEQQRSELARLDGDRGPAGAAAQFKLALLLGRSDDSAALERSLKLLGTIDAEGPRAQAALDLAKNALRAQLDARRQAARAQELQMRIDQLKALEKSLQQRDDAPKPR